MPATTTVELAPTVAATLGTVTLNVPTTYRVNQRWLRIGTAHGMWMSSNAERHLWCNVHYVCADHGNDSVTNEPIGSGQYCRACTGDPLQVLRKTTPPGNGPGYVHRQTKRVTLRTPQVVGKSVIARTIDRRVFKTRTKTISLFHKCERCQDYVT